MPDSKPARKQDQVKRKRQNSRGTDGYDSIYCGGFTGDQELPRWEINFLCTLKVNSPFLHQTLLLAISLVLLTFFSDQNSFFRDTHDSKFRVATLSLFFFLIHYYDSLFSPWKTFSPHEKHVHESLTKIQQPGHC